MKKRDFEQDHMTLLHKTNRVLKGILCALLIILIRIWYLSSIQYEEKFEDSKKTQRKTVIEPAIRATIRDRFNKPLSINKVAYRANVLYTPIRTIPSFEWGKDENGTKQKIPKRKTYIHELSEFLAKELHLEADRIEDLIHSKAALYNAVPYTLKDELTENEYFRLKARQKDWPGLQVERYAKREYPKGKCSCDLIGYLGAISRGEYENAIREKRGLEEFLNEWETGEAVSLPKGFKDPSELLKRYKELQELAYTPQDFVGKSGVESFFEESLRGFKGHKSFYSDSKGVFLKELPGAQEAIPGKRILLSISEELQEFAEGLLAQNEDIRFAKISTHGKKSTNKKQPWIKGGAIIVLDPNTGELLTLASYPRFDPNDFVPSTGDIGRTKKGNINRWFEQEAHIAAIWNQKRPLERERYDRDSGLFFEETEWLAWDFFLERILPENHSIINWFKHTSNLGQVIEILRAIDAIELKGKLIQDYTNEELALLPSLGKILSTFPTLYTKLLFIDLCQLIVCHTSFSDSLAKKAGTQSLNTYHEAAGAYDQLQEATKEIAKELFHSIVFKRWREVNEKSFLKEKRVLEKEQKTYPKPYLDYLDEKEAELFSHFFQKVRFDLLMTLISGQSPQKPTLKAFFSHFEQLHAELLQGAHPALYWRKSFEILQKIVTPFSIEELQEYLRTLRPFKDLLRPLRGTYKRLKGPKPHLEKHLAAAFYPPYGFGYGRSQAFRQAATQGSIFKLVTAYESLIQINQDSLKKGKNVKIFNPLEINEQIFKIGKQTYLGYSNSGKPIPQIYKGGRIPRSLASCKGKMDLSHAIETSSNLYFSLLASDILESPEDLANAAKKFGLGEKTGIELPGEIAGRVPTDLLSNRTGLYAMAIGQHSLVVTPLQTALLLAILANGGELLKPQIIKVLAGAFQEEDNSAAEQKLQKAISLYALGIDIPLISSNPLDKKQKIERRVKEIKRNVLMPLAIRNFLLESMRLVVHRAHQSSLSALSNLYADYPEAISDYIDLKNQLIGKTSTSEQMERMDLDENEGTNLYTHVWFGGIAFEQDVTAAFIKPEVVVVVYLRFGTFGKEAAPIAAQIVQKWREIKAKSIN